MSDMGDTFRAMREATREHRASKLAEADVTGWTEHTPYHYSRRFDGGRVEWWPSGGKCCVHAPGKRPRMVYGHGATNALIRKLIGGQPIRAEGKPLKVGKPTVGCPVRGCRARLSPIGVTDHVRDCHADHQQNAAQGGGEK